jgi:hypothetical protein
MFKFIGSDSDPINSAILVKISQNLVKISQNLVKNEPKFGAF